VYACDGSVIPTSEMIKTRHALEGQLRDDSHDIMVDWIDDMILKGLETNPARQTLTNNPSLRTPHASHLSRSTDLLMVGWLIDNLWLVALDISRQNDIDLISLRYHLLSPLTCHLRAAEAGSFTPLWPSPYGLCSTKPTILMHSNIIYSTFSFLIVSKSKHCLQESLL
jgi:hypothetical protein